ncbi:MAG: hypothetical protein ILP19_06830 [Oscillospiraceae bacterium]|nr:hypothetical protein [Oscillospiraceae bacterium]
MNIIYAQKTGAMSLSHQALFTNVIPYELLRGKLCDEYRTSDYIELLRRYYSVNPSSKCVSSMSTDGLTLFARTGRIQNAPVGFISDFTVLERIKILESCKCSDNFRLIDPAALKISDSVKLYSLSTKTVVIVVSNPDSSIFCRIDESILVDGLNAFLASLDKTGFLLDTEHKNAEIDRCIEAARACTDPT